MELKETLKILVKIINYLFCRYNDFVETISTAEEVEALAYCSSFVPHILSEEKLQNFLNKVLELIHSGLLDPAKASTEDELKVILASLLRVITLKLKKKSHFLQESQCMEEIISQFQDHVGFLSPFQKLILGRCLLRTFLKKSTATCFAVS